MNRRSVIAALFALTLTACGATPSSVQPLMIGPSADAQPTRLPTPSPVAVSTVATTATPAPTTPATPKETKPFPAPFVSPRDAGSHVGQVVMVCGVVATADYAEASNGSPTFINLDEPYPDQVFTIVIWEEQRASFGGPPEALFADARICIEGLVSTYNGVAQIISSGADIEVYD